MRDHRGRPRLLNFVIAAFGCLLWLPAPAHAQSAAPRLPLVFVDDAGTGAAEAVLAALAAAPPVPLGARVRLTLPLDAGSPIDAALAALRARQLSIWLTVSAPPTVDQVPAWQAALRALLARHEAGLAIVEVALGDQADALRRFVVQVAATEARAGGRPVLVAIGAERVADAGPIARAIGPEYAPYFDLLAVPAALDGATRTAFSQMFPTARIVRHSAVLGEGVEARADFVRDLLAGLGTATAATAWSGTPAALAAAVRALAPAASLLTHHVEPIDRGAAATTFTQDGRDISDAVTYRILFDEETFATWLVYDSAPSPQPIEVALRLAVAGTPVVFDLTTGERIVAAGYTRDEDAARSRAALPPTGRPMLVNFSEGATELFVERTGANAARMLSADEVVARHRQYQARHDALLRNYRASARMEQHFRPTLTDPGYDIVTENTYFVDDEGVEWEELSFSVNGSKWGADRPPFPLLQPEKVLSLPLELRLDTDYRYTLDGVERIGDDECYRLRFEPTHAGRALYRGTVWIDRATFARVRVQAVQTQTSAPIVANEEIHTYEPVADLAGFPLRLLTRLTARQTVLIAGRNILLEKMATFSDFRVNTSEFAAAREAARQSDRIMYRETERGLRYFVKEGEQRVVSERATARAKAMAMGVWVDPSIPFPVPIFGINYLDFEFRGRPDTQFALLFGGVLAAGNLQRPKLGGTPIDASIDFFGIAAPASDRLYTGGAERDAERLLTWPLSAGLNLGWQYTPFQKALFQYQLRFDPFVRDRTTSESFVVPSSTVTQGIGGGWEYKRGGYSFAANGTYFARANWKPWGPAEALELNPPRTYTKYAAHLSRDFYFNVVHKVHLNGSYFGGDRLDRFSRYQFGLFDDTRIHGVPASGVRFDSLAMIRGSYSLNIFELYRVDLFVEEAWGRDRSVDASWQPLTGLGVAVNLRAPWNTILRADVGKSLLPKRYRDVGSVVAQIMLLKPLK